MSSSIWEERDVLGTMSQSHNGRIVNADQKVFSHKLTNQHNLGWRRIYTLYLYNGENIESPKIMWGAQTYSYTPIFGVENEKSSSPPLR